MVWVRRKTCDGTDSDCGRINGRTWKSYKDQVLLILKEGQ